MIPGRLEAVPGRRDRTRALRLRLAGDPASDTVRTDAGGAGLMVDFDAHGRPLALEVDVTELPDAESVDRLLETLGHPPLSRKERAVLRRLG